MSNLRSRFESDTSPLFRDFGASIHIDRRLASDDIAGSIAHASMLAAEGIIPAEDAELIIAELRVIEADIAAGTVELSPDLEDIHMNIEALLTQRIGDAGKRLHTARSRNDQVALDLRLNLRREIDEISDLLRALIQSLCAKAEAHLETVMPGYTHLQRAQPTTFAHHLMAYAEMLLRDLSRLADCRRRLNVSPLGSGAVAATTYPLDRAAVASALGMYGVTRNSMDGVSDRDFVMELTASLAIIMTHLSRFAEEIILWSSGEFGFVTLSDAFSTGSSIMPQKKNPDAAELVRGKTGRVFGDLVAILTVMKSLPLAYNKDMQEDKECVFDAVDTTKACLAVLAPMLDTLTVNTAAMLAAASRGFINATDAADYLVGKGVAFRDAYAAVGALVRRCSGTEGGLDALPLGEFAAAHPAFDHGVYEAIDLINCVRRRSVVGGPAPATVAAHITEVRNTL